MNQLNQLLRKLYNRILTYEPMSSVMLVQYSNSCAMMLLDGGQ